MADISTLEEGQRAAALGADLVATTLSGYVEGPPPEDPDLGLTRDLVGAVSVPVVAEGRFRTAAHVREAFVHGAFAVVVGRAITDAAGQFVLQAPAPGTYRIRSKRIGFRPFVSAPLALRIDETTTYNAVIDPIPVPLKEVVVAGEQQCDVQAGASMAVLWEEGRAQPGPRVGVCAMIHGDEIEGLLILREL